MGVQNKPLFPDVIVDGQTIAAADIAAEAQNHAAPKGKPGLAWRAAARALVVRRLLLNAADAAGLEPKPAMLTKDLQETGDEAKIRVYLEENLNPEQISEGECRMVYDADPKRFCAPDLYQASHILLAANPSDAAARKAANLAANEVLQTLTEKPAEFARLAKTHSDCSSGQNGGQLGQLGRGDTVAEFEAALQRLATGEICAELVETRFGYHIVRMDVKAKGRQLPYEAVSASIRETLEKSAWAVGAKRLVDELLKDAVIEGVDMLPT